MEGRGEGFRGFGVARGRGLTRQQGFGVTNAASVLLKGGESLPSALQVKLGTKSMCKFCFGFLFYFTFILMAFFFFSPTFFFFKEALPPSPSLPLPSSLPKHRVQEGGAPLCFDLLFVQCCERVEEKRPLVSPARSSLLCCSGGRRPLGGAQPPPRWPAEGALATTLASGGAALLPVRGGTRQSPCLCEDDFKAK